MNIIICGAGRVGYTISKLLAEQNHSITIIDQSGEDIQKINETLDVKAIVGKATSPAVLDRANTKDADMIIAVTRNDETNMLICQIAYSLFKIPKRIARIRSQEYLDPKFSGLFNKENLPIDYVISPEIEIAKSIQRKLEAPGALDNVPFAENKIKLSQEVINVLIERSKGDRGNLKNELFKLKSLSISRKKIDLYDIDKLTNLAENYSVFELSDNYLAKNSKKVSNILNENNYSSDDCILILRTILNKAKRLLKIKNETEKNVNIEQILSTFKPPIFWKEKEILKKQVQAWTASEVKNIIYKINDLEIAVKKNTENSLNFVSDFVRNY